MDSLLLAIGGVALGLLGVVACQLWQTYLAMRRDATRVSEGGAIFVLGYFLLDGQRPCDRYRARLDLGRAIWERYGIPIWCLAGRLWHMDQTNAYYSRRYLVQNGVPAHVVRTLDEFPSLGQPVDTIQEVHAAYALSRRMNVRRLIVISDLLHLAQIRLVLRSLDVDPVFVCSRFARSWTPDQVGYVMVRVGMIILTLIDRRGQTLGWLRMWRRAEVRGPIRAMRA